MNGQIDPTVSDAARGAGEPGSIRGAAEDTVRAIGETEMYIADMAGRAVSSTVRAAGSIVVNTVDTSRDVVRAVLGAVEDIAFGLGGAGRSLAKGLVAGVEDVGGTVLGTAGRAARGTIRGVAEVGSDAGTLVEKAAGGTIGMIGNVGSQAVGAARDVLVQTASGVKDIVVTILPGTRISPPGRVLTRDEGVSEPLVVPPPSGTPSRSRKIDKEPIT